MSNIKTRSFNTKKSAIESLMFESDLHLDFIGEIIHQQRKHTPYCELDENDGLLTFDEIQKVWAATPKNIQNYFVS